MKLDRNLPGRTGKYALIKLRPNPHSPILGIMPHASGVDNATIVDSRAIDYGNTPDTDFFVIRLKDKYAPVALAAYALAAANDDTEYSNEILELAKQSLSHPNRKKPD